MGAIKTGSISDRFLSHKTTNSLKGLFAMMVLISHLHGRVGLFSHSIFGTMFSAFGYLAVSGFFFVSGFGLYTCIQSKENYIQRFPKRKLLPYYATSCCVILLYLLRDVMLVGSVDWGVFLRSFFFGGTIVDTGWYLQAQLVLYLIAYFAFRFSKHGILWTMVAVCGYCVICAMAGMSTFWYEAVPCFAVGMLCARHKESMIGIIENKKKIAAISVILLLAFLISLLMGNKRILPELMRILIKMLSVVCFNGLVVIAAAYISVVNPVTTFWGKYSLEIYVMQPVFLSGCRTWIENDWLYMLTVVVLTFVAAVVAKPVLAWAGKRLTA